MKKEHNFEHAVFKCAALVENQADANKAKRICIDNDLPIWDRRDAFDINDSDDDGENYLFLGGDNQFYVDVLDEDYLNDNNFNPVSLTYFQTLAEDYAGDQYDSIEDILAVFKQAIK